MAAYLCDGGRKWTGVSQYASVFGRQFTVWHLFWWFGLLGSDLIVDGV